MVTLAIVLIVLALVMGALGIFVQGANILLWLGIIAAIAAVIIYAVNGTHRGGPTV